MSQIVKYIKFYSVQYVYDIVLLCSRRQTVYKINNVANHYFDFLINKFFVRYISGLMVASMATTLFPYLRVKI